MESAAETMESAASGKNTAKEPVSPTMKGDNEGSDLEDEVLYYEGEGRDLEDEDSYGGEKKVCNPEEDEKYKLFMKEAISKIENGYYWKTDGFPIEDDKQKCPC